MTTRLVLDELDFYLPSLATGLVIVVVVVVGSSSSSGSRGALSLDAPVLAEAIAVALVVVGGRGVCLLLIGNFTCHDDDYLVERDLRLIGSDSELNAFGIETRGAKSSMKTVSAVEVKATYYCPRETRHEKRGVTNAARVRAFKVKKLLPEMSKSKLERVRSERENGIIKSKECRWTHAKFAFHQSASSIERSGDPPKPEP